LPSGSWFVVAVAEWEKIAERHAIAGWHALKGRGRIATPGPLLQPPRDFQQQNASLRPPQAKLVFVCLCFVLPRRDCSEIIAIQAFVEGRQQLGESFVIVFG
jgi:hypothetical protein